MDRNWLIYCYTEVNLAFININKTLILNFNSWDLSETVRFEGGLGMYKYINSNIKIMLRSQISNSQREIFYTAKMKYTTIERYTCFNWILSNCQIIHSVRYASIKTLRIVYRTLLNKQTNSYTIAKIRSPNLLYWKVTFVENLYCNACQNA